MKLDVQAPVLALAAGQVLSLDDVEGLRIRARRGKVWVTEEGSLLDNIVRPGDTLIVAHGGRTVVQAMDSAWISLAEGAGAANDSPGREPVMPSLPSWYADGFRWIASLFSADAGRPAPLAENHGGENSYLTPLIDSAEDYISDTRLRVHSRQL